MRTKFKQWAVDFLDEHPEFVIDKIDLNNDFFKDKNISIEVGSGKGDFICAMAKRHPENNYLAVERVRTVAGMMAKKIFEQEIENIRVFPNDAKIIFDAIEEEYCSTIYLNFVDPWPKKKHAKRRLTFITFLENYYRLLKTDGLLIFKSDNDGLYEFTLEELEKTKFTIISNDENYIFDESNDEMTEYERKFRNVGKSIHRIICKK